MSSIFKNTGMFRKFDGIIKNQLRRQLQSDKSNIAQIKRFDVTHKAPLL